MSKITLQQANTIIEKAFAKAKEMKVNPLAVVVLDASVPGDEPVARVHIPARIPLGFHGNWIPTAR